jgi:prepilin-type N-terminal cleavage/methylation domain-containing protein
MKILETMKLERMNRSVQAGMTLVEVIIALLILSVAVSCMVSGYVFAIHTAERSALSLAAGNLCLEQLEETRAGRWDILSYPIIDQLQPTNFRTWVVLDVAGSGTGVTYATNDTKIYQISTDPPLRGIRVECFYRFNDKQWITNVAETARAPD